MTDISKLKVSLTKHGAHKIYRLLKKLELDEVLKNTWDTFESIKIDKAQARNILSGTDGDHLPLLWQKAKNLGDEHLKQLVFIAIIFSHHDIIQAFSESGNADFTGRIERKAFRSNKAYTNLKNDTIELGFCTNEKKPYFEYDLTSILSNSALASLVTELFTLKLVSAGWDQKNTLVDECIANSFHLTLSTTENNFRNWLSATGDNLAGFQSLADTIDVENELNEEFQFSSGHSPKKEGHTAPKQPATQRKSRLKHNELENLLYKILVKQHGAENIGTEIATGSEGTTIDIVVQQNNEIFDFYEIKTAVSVKKCIRQALPQLIEYAYWPSTERAKNLIIVAEAKLTNDAQNYLQLLQNKFGIPIQYRQLDTEDETLI